MIAMLTQAAGEGGVSEVQHKKRRVIILVFVWWDALSVYNRL